MHSSTDLTSDHAAWGKVQGFDEKIVAGLGVVAFCLVVAGSIFARLSLEVSGAVEQSPTRPATVDARALARGDILIPVTLSLKLANGKAIVRGTVPDEKAHDTVIARAKEMFGSSNVEDRLGIEPGIFLTPWFDSVLKWFPPKVEQIHNGEISVKGMNVLLFGQVSDIAARIAAGSSLARLVGAEGHVVNDLQVMSNDDIRAAPRSQNP